MAEKLCVVHTSDYPEQTRHSAGFLNVVEDSVQFILFLTKEVTWGIHLSEKKYTGLLQF